MNEEEKLPFFLNTRRHQRAGSYFDIGRTPHEQLRKLLVQKSISDSVPISCQDLEQHASVGFYGVSRYISLEPDPDEDGSLDKDFIEIDEDVQFENTSAFSLFWMTFKRIALSISEHFPAHKLSTPGALNDLECNNIQDTHSEELCKVLVDPSFRDPRIKQSKIVYGDVNYLIQKFRMDLNCGSLDIALFSVEFPTSEVDNINSTDLQTYVVSPECGSFVWIENGKASAIFMTKSSTDFFGTVMEWFRKILSDMALADSVMIGHPYYWHATVRRRLTKVTRYLKRLYRNLALKEKGRHKITPSDTPSSDAIEVICPTEISKVVINEQPSENLLHTCSTYEKLNIMLEQLVKKWLEYQRNLKQSYNHCLRDISRTWSECSPQSLNRPVSDDGNFLESVTFLDFHPDKREGCNGSTEVSNKCISSSLPGEKDSNNNISAKEEHFASEMSCLDTGQGETENFQSTESSHLLRKHPDVRDESIISTRLSATSIEMEDSERNVTSTFEHQ